MSKFSKNFKVVKNCQNCQKLLKHCQNCRKLSKYYSLVLNLIRLCCVKKAICICEAIDSLEEVLSNHVRSITLSRSLEPWLFKILVAPTTFHQHFYHYILLSPTLLHLHSAFTNTFTLTFCFHQHVYTHSLLSPTRLHLQSALQDFFLDLFISSDEGNPSWSNSLYYQLMILVKWANHSYLIFIEASREEKNFFRGENFFNI